MNRTWLKTLAPWMLGLAGGIGLVVVTGRALGWPVGSQAATRISVPVVVNDAPLERDNKFTSSFASVVKKVAPSVVNISTSKTVRQSPMMPFFSDPFFRRFFGDDNGSGQPRSFKEHSLGSGVIVTKDGYILTNNHVVDGADEIKVSLAKGKKEFDAKVVGRDPKTDVAVLKIDARDLPTATLANSDKLEVGDVVLAIGSPFGLSQTVTMGIVSAVGRSGMGLEDYEDFIQTDAAINPGNSGGALVDAEGRLIGINTAILSRTGGNQGVGFAVPVNLARNIMEKIIKTGRVDRGSLGVYIQDLTPELADEFNVPANQGALVGQVVENSAAAAAGLKRGDVVIELDGKKIKDRDQLRMLVGSYAPGDKVNLKVLRQGKERAFEVTLKAQANQTLAANTGDQGQSDDDALNGVTVSDLDAGARSQLNLPASIQGAVVVDIDENSAAFERGLRRGDVIQEINHRPIRSAEDAVAACKGQKGRRMLLLVYSQGGSRYVVVQEGKRK